MKRNTVALVAALMLAAPGWAQQQPAEGDVQPRFVWGLLIQVAVSKLASYSWDIFSKWLETKIPAITERAVPNLSADSGAQIQPRSSNAISVRGGASVPGNPAAPLSTDGGRENYQGLHVALVAAAPDGSEFTFRPISGGFKTGERFKVRVVSTFAGELTIDNINPAGERKHIYPPRSDDVVAVQPGRETFIPLGKDEYFEFTRATGREQLVINIADPRAVGESASRAQVYRQDQRYGSNFLQQLAPNTYPRISQPIELQHSAH